MQSGVESLKWILIAVMVVMGSSFVLFLVAYFRLTKLNKHLAEMLPAGGSLDELVGKYISTLEQVQQTQARLAERIAALEKWTETAVSKVGIVRYNAFAGVGGDQSFSLAILKGNGEGIILSGIYGRDETRVYAKPVKDGKSPYPLSDEEESILNATANAERIREER